MTEISPSGIEQQNESLQEHLLSFLDTIESTMKDPAIHHAKGIDPFAINVMNQVFAEMRTQLGSAIDAESLFLIQRHLLTLQHFFGLHVSPALRRESHEEGLVTVDTQVLQKIHRALLYNDSNRTLIIANDETLPMIPGKITCVLDQTGDKYRLGFVLRPSEINRMALKQAPNLEEQRWKTAFEALHYNDPQVQKKYQSTYFSDRLYRRFGNNTDSFDRVCALDRMIGPLPISESPGYQKTMIELIHFKLIDFLQALPTVLGDQFVGEIVGSGSSRDHSIKVLITDTVPNEIYHLTFSTVLSQEGKADIQIVFSAANPNTSVEQDYEKFAPAFEKQLSLANRVLSWFYQDSCISRPADKKIKIQTPDQPLTNFLRDNKLLYSMINAPNSFNDLGGQHALKQSLEKTAANVFLSLQGKSDNKPALVLLYGSTGKGKTSMSNAVCDSLVKSGIPVFVLKPTEATSELLNNNLNALKDLFYYLQINGGVLQIQDLELLLGKNPIVRGQIEMVLNTELEKIKKCPHAWIIVDTEDISLIRPSLLNAHRIGEKILVPYETYEESITEMLLTLLGKIDARRNSCTGRLPFSQIREKYPLNYQYIAKTIAVINLQAFDDEKDQKPHTGIIPGQLERLLINSFDTAGGISTDSLQQAIEDYIKQERELHEIRRSARLQELERIVLDLRSQVEQRDEVLDKLLVWARKNGFQE